MSQISYPQLNWRAAGTTSDAIELSGQTVCGFLMPGTFAGTSFTVQVCDTKDGTYLTLRDSSAAISYTSTTSVYIRANPQDFAGVRFMRIVSGSSEAAGTVVKLAVREIA